MADTSNTTPNKMTAALSTTQPESYDTMTGQEAQAHQAVQSTQTTDTTVAGYDSGLQGSEVTANTIVSTVRSTDTTTTTTVSEGRFDLSDARTAPMTAEEAARFNQLDSAAGMPFSMDARSERPTSALTGEGQGITEAATTALNKPAAGQTQMVDAQFGQLLQANFDPNTAELSLQGKNLVMTFEDGSRIILQNFAADAQNMPTIALQNGVLVSGGIILAQLQGTNEDVFNLETAAGPAAGAGGGQFRYSDDLGSVIDLLNKLPPIPFTALQFPQPETREFVGDETDSVGGTFVPEFETVDGLITIAGGFEDWQAGKNAGDMTQTPMALNLAFTPDDNEVVDTVTISNIPSTVQFFYGTTGSYAPLVIVGGSVTLTAAQLASGNVFVLAQPRVDGDIPMTVTMQITDPDNGQSAILSQNVVAVVDAVADMPVISTAITVGGTAGTTGQQGDQIVINAVADFPDADGSEIHVITLSGVPQEWTLVSSAGVVFTPTIESNGTVTYTATVSSAVSTPITFNPNGWTGSAGAASLQFIAQTTEQVTDGELLLTNNQAVTSTEFAITLTPDNVPEIIRPTSVNLLENTLSIPGVDTTTGSILVDFNGDGPGSFALTTTGLSGLGLTSQGEALSYSVSPNGQVLTAVDVANNPVFTVVLNAPTTNGTEQTATYTFTLLQPLDHANALGTNNLPIPFNFVVTDSDGDSASGNFTVSIIDDVPVAVADTNNIPNGGTTASGNVITNDDPSVDINNVLKDVTFGGTTKSFASPDGTDAGGRFVIMNGAYGQIKIYENGAYTYTYNAAANSGSLTEVFNYTLVDFDGDASVAPLTITIVDNGPGNAPTITRTIDETTDINANTSGTITVAGATDFDLVAGTFTSGGSQLGGALTSNGVPVVVSLVSGQYVGMAGSVQVFTLSLNASGQYSFIMKAPIDQANASDPNDTIVLNFGYVATDADGDSSAGGIQIIVRDDAPIAVGDTNNVPNGSTTASGNVITNDDLSVDVNNVLGSITFTSIPFGINVTKSFATPDGSDAGGSFILINGLHGVLKIYQTGQYTYTYNAAAHSGSLVENFSYQLVDFDGDASNAPLIISIFDAGPTNPPVIQRTIDETSDINANTSGTITVAGATEYDLGAVNGALGFSATGSLLGGNLTSKGVPVTVALVGGQYVGTANGVQVFTLSLNDAGQYNFVLKAPIDQANASDPNDVIALNFTYTARDADGDSVESTIRINVRDDAPLAFSDLNIFVDTAVTTGNVITGANGGAGAADTLSKDVSTDLQSVSQGAVTKLFSAALVDAGGKYVMIDGVHGQLKLYENGQYSYTLNGGIPLPGNGGSITETFTYTIRDFDGDISTTTLTLQTVTPKLIVGENVDDTSTSTTPYEVGTGTGVITGTSASDILIGDVGGSNLQSQSQDYNIVLVLDTSSSMSGTKIALLKNAVNNLLTDFNGYDGGSVKVHIVTFGTNVVSQQTFTVTNDTEFASATSFVNGLVANGFTNYEAPLQAAINWYSGNTANDPIVGATNFTYFISDGEPNRFVDDLGVVQTASATTAMDQITGIDGTNEVSVLQGFGEVVGVGIGVTTVTLGRLGVIDSGTDAALNVINPEDLNAALQSVNPLNQLSGLGDDVLVGGAGNDLIFGDALNTDALAVAEGLTTAPGAGWLVFAELEANHGWTRADTLAYIQSNREQLAAETINDQGQGRLGGNDTLVGGEGADILFGQEGDDVLDGGIGNDILSGGSGLNTITGGEGADTFLFLQGGGADVITDYSTSQQDRLDISDLLTGSTYLPGVSSVDDFVRIDQTTGHVFVDATGTASFEAGNVVATLNGISGIDTVNVILSDSEGLRSVHTV